jgi:GT2 family glycosyltransferase
MMDADPDMAQGVHKSHVAVVVLTHNGRENTLTCLDSLAHASWSPLTVVLVDNGSRDATTEAVRDRYPTVSLIREEENVGFASGCNVGIRHALDLNADYVLLLNNDTTLASNAIALCVDVAQRHTDAGAVCPLIYFAQPTNLIWYAGATFDPARARSGRMLGYRELDCGQFVAVEETARATGAAMLIPRGALERVGLLDADLFFLYEDVDWSLRARRAGYRLYLAPRAKVWHRVSASAGGEHSPKIAYYDTRNHILVCRRYSSSRGLVALTRELAVVALHLAAARRSTHPLAYMRSVIDGWWDVRRGRLGPRP